MNVRASPLLQTNFSKLPPALILVAELDPLKDACYGQLDVCVSALVLLYIYFSV